MSKLNQFYEQHPQVLAEKGDTPYSEQLMQELELSKSWDSFCQTFAFVDFSMLVDQMKTRDYQMMVSLEECERQKREGYVSDAWLKGRLSVLAELKHHISSKIENLETLAEKITEAQESETIESSL